MGWDGVNDIVGVDYNTAGAAGGSSGAGGGVRTGSREPGDGDAGRAGAFIRSCVGRLERWPQEKDSLLPS